MLWLSPNIVLFPYRKLRKRTSALSIVNFCISLLLLLTTFIVTTNLNHPSPTLCHTMSALLHVFTLSTFAWTSVQAFFLYKKAVRATKNRGESRRAFYTCFCLAWGMFSLPAVAHDVRTTLYGR